MNDHAKIFWEHPISPRQLVQIVRGDITQEKVDAIVNAANKYLQHGGGVAGAISRAGGSIIQQESDAWVQKYGPITHSKPAFTHPGNLPCRYVIHAAGPIWGEGDEEQKLQQTIRGCFLLGEKLGITSIAFPAISTGIFGFPCDQAARIFKKEIFHFFEKHPSTNIKRIRLVLFDPSTLQTFLAEFRQNNTKES